MDFAGDWHLTRHIEDRRGPDGRFDGLARLMPVVGGLGYHEAGMLHCGPGPAMRAERRYLWQEDGPLIRVLFQDGRDFHLMDPQGPRCEARHDCAPDLYRVAYDFSDWPDWSAEWQVQGPLKDYRMHSLYRPAGAAGGRGG